MPWTAADAQSHHGGANTPKLKKLWASTANSVLSETGDEGRAVRIANNAVNRAKKSLVFAELLNLLMIVKARHLVLMPDDEKRAFSPFPYDKKFLKHLRPDQVPRFLRCITDPWKLPTIWISLDKLSALQDRVDVAKVETIRGLPGLGAPVVVRIRKDGNDTIADGLHRCAADWLEHRDNIVVHYCDLSEKEGTVEPVPGAGKFDRESVGSPLYPVDGSEMP